MSDDLIKRDDAPEQIFASQGDDGWRWPRASKFPEQGPHENVKYVRADRIEELEGERDEAMMTGHDLAKIEYRDLVSDLEAKLAKAVEALRFYAAVYKSPFGNRARIVLAKLEKTE